MEAFTGDGSSWSYLAASILARELEEFGAAWHGCSWSTHTILDKNLLNNRSASVRMQGRLIDTRPRSWKWLRKKPVDWRPQVTIKGGRRRIVFYTYSYLNQESIYQHEDTYLKTNYFFKTVATPVAIGPAMTCF
jgi:hypothetical protein